MHIHILSEEITKFSKFHMLFTSICQFLQLTTLCFQTLCDLTHERK